MGVDLSQTPGPAFCACHGGMAGAGATLNTHTLPPHSRL
jgi:hypothetical protein